MWFLHLTLWKWKTSDCCSLTTLRPLTHWWKSVSTSARPSTKHLHRHLDSSHATTDGHIHLFPPYPVMIRVGRQRRLEELPVGLIHRQYKPVLHQHPSWFVSLPAPTTNLWETRLMRFEICPHHSCGLVRCVGTNTWCLWIMTSSKMVLWRLQTNPLHCWQGIVCQHLTWKKLSYRI